MEDNRYYSKDDCHQSLLCLSLDMPEPEHHFTLFRFADAAQLQQQMPLLWLPVLFSDNTESFNNRMRNSEQPAVTVKCFPVTLTPRRAGVVVV